MVRTICSWSVLTGALRVATYLGLPFRRNILTVELRIEQYESSGMIHARARNHRARSDQDVRQ
jgi:hypothetical protein